jgi:CRP-like cAMP-binding protein
VVLEWQMPHAGRKIVQVLTTGDVLGWSWLFPPYFCHFTARALEPSEAVFIYATPLREESESDHDLAYELLKRMSRVMETRLCAARREWLDQPNAP